MKVAAALKKFDIDPKFGATRAIQTVGEMITGSPDPLTMANSVIVELGGSEELSFPEARIKAKSFVEQAVLNVDTFNPEEAEKIAANKVVQLVRKMPELKAETAVSSVSAAKSTGKRGRPATKTADGSSLKAKAVGICEANASLTNAQLAQMIQKELKISYSNAYYYSSRVFKRK